MRISNKQYARALFELTDEKEKSELPAIIEQFVAELIRRHDTSRTERILTEYVKLWQASNSVVEAEVTTAHTMTDETKHTIAAYVAKWQEVKEVVLKSRVVPEVLAGVILRVGDQVIDASTRQQVKKLEATILK
ncbi:MAG: ATP synthase F1 subunit delta [Candidatus Falkowbacteria bacterium]